MNYNQNIIDALSNNKNLINIEPHKTNLVLHTVYTLTDTNRMLTLYILQGESGQQYLCDIGSIFDVADDLGLDIKVVKANADKFNLSVEDEKIYCIIDQNNIQQQLNNFIFFGLHLGII